jgi:signal transduction histidine kinase
MKITSLAVRTLVKMSMRISVIMIVVTGASYLHLLHTTEEQTKDTLSKYIIEREARERINFDSARRNHEVLRSEFLSSYHGYLKNPLTPKMYSSLVKKYADGASRNSDANFNGQKIPGIFVGPAASNDLKTQAKILASYDITYRFGVGYHHSFQDTYLTFPDNSIVLYWPEQPKWALEAKPTLDLSVEEYATVSNPQNNPLRKTVWTGLFYDKVSKIWMVTASTPIYDNDVYIGSVHHDLMVTELIQRTLNDHLKGAQNFIVRSDGRLIAHPLHLEEIKKHDGNYLLKEGTDPELLDQYNLARSLDDGAIGNDNYDNYLAVSKIDGPDWLLVSKYPRQIVRTAALENVGFLLGAGLFSLILEIIVLYFVLRREISIPLMSLMKTTNNIAKGNYGSLEPNDRSDELGLLRGSIGQMSEAIQERDLMLARHNEDLESLIVERNRELDEQKTINLNASKMSALGEMAGGMAHEINTPLATIKLLTSQAHQSVQDDIPDLDKVAENLKQIDGTVDRVAKIVRGLKSFARNGNNDPLQETSVRSIIDDTISLCTERFRLRGVQLTVSIPPEDLIINCRAVEICQVVLNLINNAFDAVSELEEKWVTLQVINFEEDVEIRVTDSGPGIPETLQEKIFNPFFTTKAVGQGTGMGLSISHGIIKTHGGKIFLDKSSMNTCFVIRMPKKHSYGP